MLCEENTHVFVGSMPYIDYEIHQPIFAGRTLENATFSRHLYSDGGQHVSVTSSLHKKTTGRVRATNK